MRVSFAIVVLILNSLGVVGCLKRAGGGGDRSWADPGQMDTWRTAFVDSGYIPCDAEALAMMWGLTVPDAKAKFGMMLSSGVKSYELEQKMLFPARQAAGNTNRRLCSLEDNGFAESDAKLIAQSWGTDVGSARASLEEKLTWGGRYAVDDALKYASMGYVGDGTDGGAEAEAVNAFYNAGLSYCDAEILAASWSIDTWEAKITLGMKINAGYSMEDIQSTYLSPARQQYTNNNQVCELYETNFTGADAERLACFWGVGLEESKARIAQKVTHGSAEDVTMLLKAATSRGCR
jgi:hypothetical protein